MFVSSAYCILISRIHLGDLNLFRVIDSLIFTVQVLLLMRNLSINLTNPDFEGHVSVIKLTKLNLFQVSLYICKGCLSFIYYLFIRLPQFLIALTIDIFYYVTS